MTCCFPGPLILVAVELLMGVDKPLHYVFTLASQALWISQDSPAVPFSQELASVLETALCNLTVLVYFVLYRPLISQALVDLARSPCRCLLLEPRLYSISYWRPACAALPCVSRAIWAKASCSTFAAPILTMAPP